ncbi:MAG: Flp family type IVb pilin [Burkholderiaceae bacterium]
MAMRARVRRLRLPREQRGVTAIEYAILAGIIASALVIVLGSLGTEVAAMFDKIVAAFG